MSIAKNMSVSRDLIYDFGVNDGSDAGFYLEKGFRVVGVEANPQLYKILSEKFGNYIASGQLNLLNIGVWSESKDLPFYVNLDNDHWSSFDKSYGCRDNTRYETINIECVTVGELIDRFGMPHYMKIDVEGADRHILSALAPGRKPTFISVEEYGVECIDQMYKLGYSHFNIVPQNNKSAQIPPNPPAEGKYAPRVFSGVDSGLFGKELPGQWMPYSAARTYFITNIRAEDRTWRGGSNEWYDVHGTVMDTGLIRRIVNFMRGR